MNFDSLLVFIGLVFTAYSILPDHKKLELKFRWSHLNTAILVISFIFINYLFFFQTFKALGFSPGFNLHKYKLNPKNFAYISLVFAFFIVSLNVLRTKLKRKNIAKFRTLISELYREKRYYEITRFLNKRLKTIKKIYYSDFYFSKIKKKYSKNSFDKLIPNPRK